MQDRLNKEFNPKNLSQLKRALKKIWWEIDQKTIQTLFKSMNRRMREVIVNKGDITSY